MYLFCTAVKKCIRARYQVKLFVAKFVKFCFFLGFYNNFSLKIRIHRISIIYS